MRFMWILFVMMSIPLFPVIQLYTNSVAFAFGWLGLVALAYTLVHWGARWHLTIHPHGILLQRSKLWVFPHSDRHFSLDAEITAYYSAEHITTEDVAEGYEVIPASTALPDRIRFGPDSNDPQFEETLQAIQAALLKVRSDYALQAVA